MLRLVNIRNNEKTIEADYIPESTDLRAHISVDKETQEYEAESIEKYEWCYPRMAANGLIRTLEELSSGLIKEAPSERLVMWY